MSKYSVHSTRTEHIERILRDGALYSIEQLKKRGTKIKPSYYYKDDPEHTKNSIGFCPPHYLLGEVVVNSRYAYMNDNTAHYKPSVRLFFLEETLLKLPNAKNDFDGFPRVIDSIELENNVVAAVFPSVPAKEIISKIENDALREYLMEHHIIISRDRFKTPKEYVELSNRRLFDSGMIDELPSF